MKAGFAVSVAAHLLALAVLLLTFSAPPLAEIQPTEEIPISLVPLGDVMSVKQGDKRASQKAPPSPKRTKKPETKPNAENAGDAEIDTKSPLNPKLKAREVKAPPPPKGEEQGKTEPAPKPAEPEPKPAEPEAKPEPPKPVPVPAPPKPAEPKPAAPKPAEPAPEAPKDDIGDLLKAEEAKTAAPPKAEEKPKEAEQAKPAPQPKPAPKPAPQPKPEPKKGEKDGAQSENSRNALIDRTRTQGGGAKRSNADAGAGADKTIGDQAALQQTLNNVIGSCVQRSWDIGVLQGGSAYDLRVQMHFKLNPDGTLAGEPDMTPAGGDLKDRDVISVQARAALKKCAPFRLPADKYSQWRDVTVNMRAFPD